jgi:hypothetical protein
MQKIISLFQRNYETDRLVRNEVIPGAEWVVNGEGVPTEKIDGTSCLIKDGLLYKRYDVKKGKTAPEGFIPAQDPDLITGHWPGWLIVNTMFPKPEDKWHVEAWDAMPVAVFDGTYELIGPKVQGNPYHRDKHTLEKHGAWRFDCDVPRDFEGLKAFLETHNVEGIVWHHADGRMVKIKARDFGLTWPARHVG